MFNAFGVLTSAGIQRRYIRAVSQRDDISIIKEYWLLDATDRKDVPTSVLNKIAYKSALTNGNPDKTSFKPHKTSENPQSRGKKSTGNEKKGNGAPPTPTPEPVPEAARHKHGRYGWVLLSDDELARLLAKHGRQLVDYYVNYIDELAQQTGNKNRWKDWNLTIQKAIRDKWGKPPAADSPTKDYDDDEDFCEGR